MDKTIEKFNRVSGVLREAEGSVALAIVTIPGPGGERKRQLEASAALRQLLAAKALVQTIELEIEERFCHDQK